MDVPALIPFTTPLLDTDDDFVLELLHFMVSVVLLGDMVPFKVYVFPTLMNAEVLFIATLVDGTFFSFFFSPFSPLLIF